jgi:hypothetical protein
MKNFILVLFTMTVIACKDRRDTSLILTGNKPTQDTLRWIDNFKQFRNAVYQNDRVQVKQFMDFPILNENNEIWHLVYEGSEKAMDFLSDKIKPFTESDFDRYYGKIFSKRFITAILKVKSDELYKTGSMETQELSEDSTTYQMHAKFDQSTNSLQLNLNWNTPIYNGDGTIDPGEGSIMYEFTVLSNGQIKFKQIRLAG